MGNRTRLLVVSIGLVLSFGCQSDPQYWVLRWDVPADAFESYMGERTFPSKEDAELAARAASTRIANAPDLYIGKGCRIVYEHFVSDCEEEPGLSEASVEWGESARQMEDALRRMQEIAEEREAQEPE